VEPRSDVRTPSISSVQVVDGTARFNRRRAGRANVVSAAARTVVDASRRRFATARRRVVSVVFELTQLQLLVLLLMLVVVSVVVVGPFVGRYGVMTGERVASGPAAWLTSAIFVYNEPAVNRIDLKLIGIGN